MEFYEKLQSLRKGKGITQEELAEKLNVSRQAVSKWESGQAMPEINKIIQIADLFKISLDCLLKDVMEEQNENKVIYANTIQSKSINWRFISGIVLFSIGFISVLAFYIVYILHPVNLINKSGIHSGFDIFLRANDILIIFLICCLFSFLGLLLISKNIIANIITKICSSYSRLSRIIKYGIVVSFLGTIMIFVSQIIMLNQSVITETSENVDLTGKTVILNTVQSQSFNPKIILISSLMVTVSGFIMLVIGIIEKFKNSKARNR